MQDNGLLVIPTVPGSPPKQGSGEILSEDYQSRTHSLLAIASMSGCCQVLSLSLSLYPSLSLSLFMYLFISVNIFCVRFSLSPSLHSCTRFSLFPLHFLCSLSPLPPSLHLPLERVLHFSFRHFIPTCAMFALSLPLTLSFHITVLCFIPPFISLCQVLSLNLPLYSSPSVPSFFCMLGSLSLSLSLSLSF